MIQRATAASAVPAAPTCGPVRTCIGCRSRASATELLRVVAGPGPEGSPVITVDEAASLPGRGAWLHTDLQCLHAAIRRRAFARALRLAGSPDTTAVVGYVERSVDASAATAHEDRQRNT